MSPAAGRPPLRHGVTILPEHPWREARPMWRAAEELGFDHAWTYDHLVWSGLPDADTRQFQDVVLARTAGGTRAS